MTIELFKKHREEAVFAQFRQLYKNFPVGEYFPAERPDFVIKTPQQLLGVELTQLHEITKNEDNFLTANEAGIYKLLSLTKKRYDLNQEPDCYVSIIFNPTANFEQPSEEIIDRLIEAVLRFLPAPGEFAIIDFPALGLIHGCTFISRLLIYTYPDKQGLGSIFHSPRSLWLSKVDRTHVERSLIAKENKYPSYRAETDEVWLLIELNGYFSATEIYGIEQLFKEVYSSSFSKVFILSSFENRLFELNVHAKVLA